MARKETPAHAKALKTARMWNRRAAAKENRMRKDGVTNISEVSPRVNPKDLPSLSTQELRRYAHALNEFVSERYMKLPSAEVVPRREWTALKRDVQRENRRRAEMQARLEQTEFPGARRIEERMASWRRLDPETLQPLPSARGTGSPIEPIIMTEPPRTAAAFRTRREWAHRISREAPAVRVARQRASAVGMALQTGNEQLASMLMKASTFQLQYMVERLDLLEKLSLLYTSPSDIERGVATMRELMDEYDNGSYDQQVDEIARDVAQVIRTIR